MSRLTEKFSHNGFEYMATGFGSNNPYAIDKLGKLEDLEEQLGCPLEVVITPYFKRGKLEVFYRGKMRDQGIRRRKHPERIRRRSERHSVLGAYLRHRLQRQDGRALDTFGRAG